MVLSGSKHKYFVHSRLESKHINLIWGGLELWEVLGAVGYTRSCGSYLELRGKAGAVETPQAMGKAEAVGQRWSCGKIPRAVGGGRGGQGGATGGGEVKGGIPLPVLHQVGLLPLTHELLL